MAALLFYADISDIDSVGIDGVACKWHVKLTGLDWSSVRNRLLASRSHILGKFARIEKVEVRNAWAPLWGITRSPAEPEVAMEVHS